MKKRAKGGGAKPKGEFSDLRSVVSIRMPTAIRERLDEEAYKSGRSLTQEILIRLSESLQNVSQIRLIQSLESTRNNSQ